jgi:hypothetical protein
MCGEETRRTLFKVELVRLGVWLCRDNVANAEIQQRHVHHVTASGGGWFSVTRITLDLLVLL